MNALRQFLSRIQFSRQESVALSLIFGLYLVGLTWRYVQKTTVPFDDAFYARVDSATGDNALKPFSMSMAAALDTVPKPRKKEPSDTVGTDSPDSSGSVQMSTGRMNVNLATHRQLTLLPGIGPSLASRIIDYRETAGRFRSVEDLLNVKGIGPRTLERFQGMVVVE
jgi:comEA protein